MIDDSEAQNRLYFFLHYIIFSIYKENLLISKLITTMFQIKFYRKNFF